MPSPPSPPHAFGGELAASLALVVEPGAEFDGALMPDLAADGADPSPGHPQMFPLPALVQGGEGADPGGSSGGVVAAHGTGPVPSPPLFVVPLVAGAGVVGWTRSLGLRAVGLRDSCRLVSCLRCRFGRCGGGGAPVAGPAAGGEAHHWAGEVDGRGAGGAGFRTLTGSRSTTRSGRCRGCGRVTSRPVRRDLTPGSGTGSGGAWACCVSGSAAQPARPGVGDRPRAGPGAGGGRRHRAQAVDHVVHRPRHERDHGCGGHARASVAGVGVGRGVTPLASTASAPTLRSG